MLQSNYNVLSHRLDTEEAAFILMYFNSKFAVDPVLEQMGDTGSRFIPGVKGERIGFCTP